MTTTTILPIQVNKLVSTHFSFLTFLMAHLVGGKGTFDSAFAQALVGKYHRSCSLAWRSRGGISFLTFLLQWDG